MSNNFDLNLTFPSMTFASYLRNILQLILSPTNAWKDIQRGEAPFEVAVQRGLYPLMSVMLLTVFIRPIYGIERFDLVQVLQSAVIQFIALFVALYVGRSVMEHYLPQYNCTGENDPLAVGNVAVYGTGLMTVIQIIENLIPVELTVIQLLPAFAAVCLWKSNDYLDISPKGEAPFMLISILALIAPVIIINIVLSLIIN